MSFVRRHKPVSMDLTETKLRALAAGNRGKQQNVLLRQVFKTLDADGDGFVDAAELHTRLVRLGYTPESGEAQDIIWEVDDDCDSKISWREFKSIYHRVQADDKGVEPRAHPQPPAARSRQ